MKVPAFLHSLIHHLQTVVSRVAPPLRGQEEGVAEAEADVDMPKPRADSGNIRGGLLGFGQGLCRGFRLVLAEEGAEEQGEGGEGDAVAEDRFIKKLTGHFRCIDVIQLGKVKW